METDLDLVSCIVIAVLVFINLGFGMWAIVFSAESAEPGKSALDELWYRVFVIASLIIGGIALTIRLL